MKRIWQNHFKAAKRPAQGTLDIKCKLFSLTQPVRASLWTERSVNCEFLPNLNCFVKEKCRKKEDCRKANFFFLPTLNFSSLLFPGAVFQHSLLISFFVSLPLCDLQPFPFFFPHDFATKKKYTQGKNTSNFNRLKDEDTFHIWCCFPSFLMNGSRTSSVSKWNFSLAFHSLGAGKQKWKCNQQRWQWLSKTVSPKF